LSRKDTNLCSSPMDPLDVEALASGEEPSSAQARGHLAACASCAEAVRRAARLEADLGSLGAEERVPLDLADRVLRIRPFSVAEKRSIGIWAPPAALAGALALGGFALISGTAGAPSSEQAGAAAALAAAAAALVRATGRGLLELAEAAPAGASALSTLLHRSPAGWAALLLLVPAALGLRRTLARSRSLARR